MLPGKCAGYSILVIFLCLIILPVNVVLCQEMAVLQIILNEEVKGEFFLILAEDSDVWITREEFDGIGLQKGLGRDITYEQETYVSLKSVQDIEFRVNIEEVTLEITAAPHLFESKDLDASYEKPYKVRYSKDHSAFLNYAVNYDNKSEESFLGISGELGFSISDYFGMTTFLYEKSGDVERTARLLSRLTFDDRAEMRTVTFGDFTASSGILGSSSILGGINISRNFSLNPYMIKFPEFNLGGTIETPSEVAVYMDGSLVRKESLSPGEFRFNDVPATAGLGTAEIVINDVYGRESVISSPYYYSEQLLKQGLHQYSYSLGFIRQEYGKENFSYDEPAFLCSHTFGFSKNIKPGYSAEATEDLINIGPSVSFMAGNAGVVDIDIRVSSYSGDNGLSGFLGYSFKSRRLSANLFVRSDSEKYSTLLVNPGDDKPRLKFGAAVGAGSKKYGNVTAGYSYYDMHKGETGARTELSYNKTLTKRSTIFINASETREDETEYSIFAGLHIYFDNGISGSLSHMDGGGSQTSKLGIQKSPPTGDGIGYLADIINSDTGDYIDGRVQYQTDTGIYNVKYSNKDKDMGYAISAAGGIGYIDKSLFFSRPVNDSFAKVKVGGLENVGVSYYGNEVGRTNSKGELIVPNLRSFHDNRIDIESEDIPINYAIETIQQYVSPPFRSGAVIEFNVAKVQGVTGFLYIIEDGQEVPVELSTIYINANKKVIEGMIGLDGEYYFENVPQGKHTATVRFKEKNWEFDLVIPDTEETIVDAGRSICREVK
jgi:outer membrane usher protein